MECEECRHTHYEVRPQIKEKSSSSIQSPTLIPRSSVIPFCQSSVFQRKSNSGLASSDLQTLEKGESQVIQKSDPGFVFGPSRLVFVQKRFFFFLKKTILFITLVILPVL
uniref:Uncharacterized protein n=1 Tax=Salix viminalis TaxID=40686 RepID=A0A6N2LHV0_SALVM